ncbi:unnamed protein product [Enterobius vermicularis]|uniref:MRG domain-containing protein n=1 Tax=Enterobius vermicularis TaxID=51028 RepID=A0A0N4V3V1_ENTVE|nr:unnamed protein product [Enterobius vermicularis]
MKKKMARKKVRRRTVEFAVTAGNADRFSGTIQRTLTYTPNTKILCKDWNGLYYDAKVLRVEELPDASLVYGWSSRFDTRIREVDLKERVLPFTEKNAKIAEEWKQRVSYGSRFRRKSNRRDTSKRSRIRPAESCGQTEGENRQKPVSVDDIELELTDELERLLIYDQEKILGEKSLHRIPAQFTVEDILNQYLDHLVKYANRQETDSSFDNDIKLAKECVDGIKEYFNNYLWSQLLYNSERIQFIDFLRQRAKVFGFPQVNISLRNCNLKDLHELGVLLNCEPANVYGYVHLLRLFCKFATFLKFADWGATSQSTIRTAIEQLEKCARYLDYSSEKYFDCEADYVSSSGDS